MKGYLFDTNIVITALVAPERISTTVRSTVEGHPIYVSVLGYWEMLVKSMNGKLDLGDPRVRWTEAVDKLGAATLPLRPAHISAVYDLPAIHKDPYDRALIGQAYIEELTLVTFDREIAKYRSEQIRILSA